MSKERKEQVDNNKSSVDIIWSAIMLNNVMKLAKTFENLSLNKKEDCLFN